jgi:trans-aconitate methyltransferase
MGGDMGSHWSEYYDAVSNRPPRDTLLKALALFDMGPEGERFAVDLGCGAGADTREMLRRGWCVTAIDREPDGIRRLTNSVPVEHRHLLQTRVSPFERLHELPPCNLINASFSLPFCAPQHFGILWQAIVSALRPRGRFAGNLFGERDDRAYDTRMTFHTRADVERLLDPFKVEYLHEEERAVATALGDTKHRHAFHIVARKH